MHIKGTSGCGKITEEETIQIYKNKNYDAIFTTSHLKNKTYERNEISKIINSYKLLKEIGDKNNIKIFFGIELNHENTDYLIYGLTTELIEKNNICKLTFYDLLIFCTKNNALIVQAHPFREKRGKFLYKVNPFVHGIEVLNGHPKNNQHNDLAIKYATENNKIMTAGSDCHYIQGACRTAMIFENYIENEIQFIESLKNKKYKIEQYF